MILSGIIKWNKKDFGNRKELSLNLYFVILKMDVFFYKVSIIVIII